MKAAIETDDTFCEPFRITKHLGLMLAFHKKTTEQIKLLFYSILLLDNLAYHPPGKELF